MAERCRPALLAHPRSEKGHRRASSKPGPEPALFLPGVLFNALLSATFHENPFHEREVRSWIEERAAILGFGSDLWERLEKVTAPYLRLRDERNLRALEAHARSEDYALGRIFESQGIHREALEALALFCQAAKMKQAQVDWARRLIKYLYRAQSNPELKFEACR